jgi:hypothetical protein
MITVSCLQSHSLWKVKRLCILSQAILLNHFETDGMAGMDSYGNSLVGVSFSRAD